LGGHNNEIFLSLFSEDGTLIKSIKINNPQNFEVQGGIGTSDGNILIVCSNFDENKESLLN